MEFITSIFFEDQETQERYLKTHGTVKPRDISGNLIVEGDEVRFIATGEVAMVLETDSLDGSIRLILHPEPMSFWQYSNDFIKVATGDCLAIIA